MYSQQTAPDLMSPAERFSEVARLLAKAFVRSRMKNQAHAVTFSSPEKPLDFQREQSVHRVEP